MPVGGPAGAAVPRPRFEVAIPPNLLQGASHSLRIDVPDAARCDGLDVSVRRAESQAGTAAVGAEAR